MKNRKPPAVALWLLDRLGFARGNEPLVGDLLEDFGSGRSALWFWRQTLMVIANCVGRRVALLQLYWISLAAGFVAQLPLSFGLFRLRVPPPVHGLGWKAAGLSSAIVAITLVPSLAHRVFGKTSKDLKLILVTAPTGVIDQRLALIGATAFESFGSILLLYCVASIWASSAAFSSYAALAGCEFAWLAIGEATSELLLAANRFRLSHRTKEEEARSAAREQEWERAWSHLNEIQVSLICSDGSAIVLEPETCIETIFTSANEELITSLFAGGASFEQIRRAIWLASAADYSSWPKCVPLPKFVRLLGPGSEADRVRRFLDVPPAGSFLKRRLRPRMLGTTLLLVSAVYGQNAPNPQFEVASIKPGGDIFSTRPERLVGRIRWTTQLGYLIGYAYRLDFSRVDGADIGSVYTLEATFDPAATDDQIRLMLQSLLAQRFKMRAHRVTVEVDGFALLIAKNGLKIKEAKSDEEPPPLPEGFRGSPPSLRAETFISAVVLPDRGGVEITGRRVTMAQLAETLQRSTRAPVWDRTGLPGAYYFSFRYAQDLSSDADTQAPYPLLPTALQENLGLEMKKQKGPLQTLLVDHIEPPSEN